MITIIPRQGVWEKRPVSEKESKTMKQNVVKQNSWPLASSKSSPVHYNGNISTNTYRILELRYAKWHLRCTSVTVQTLGNNTKGLWKKKPVHQLGPFPMERRKYIIQKAGKLTKGGETYMFFHPFSNFTNHLFILGMLRFDFLEMVGKVCKFTRLW